MILFQKKETGISKFFFIDKVNSFIEIVVVCIFIMVDQSGNSFPVS